MSGMNPTAGYPRPPMPNGMPLPPGGPMVPAHPLMIVPPMPQAPGQAMVSSKATNVPQLLGILKDCLYPSQREVAAERLSELDGKKHPQIVEVLTKAAQEDPAATVRAACVHALAQMQVNSPQAVALMQSLRNDRDRRVRQEAEEALATLGVAAAPRQDSAIQRTSHK
jgi:hypothetical protein